VQNSLRLLLEDLSENDAVELEDLRHQESVAIYLLLKLFIKSVVVGSSLAPVIRKESINFLVLGVAHIFPDLLFKHEHSLVGLCSGLGMLIRGLFFLILQHFFGLQFDLFVENLLVTLNNLV